MSAARAGPEAGAAYREAQGKANVADAAFRAGVHPALWELHEGVGELDRAVRDASMDMHVAKLCRHFPAFAVAIRLAWEHIVDTALIDIGTCRTTIEP